MLFLCQVRSGASRTAAGQAVVTYVCLPATRPQGHPSTRLLPSALCVQGESSTGVHQSLAGVGEWAGCRCRVVLFHWRVDRPVEGMKPSWGARSAQAEKPCEQPPGLSATAGQWGPLRAVRLLSPCRRRAVPQAQRAAAGGHRVLPGRRAPVCRRLEGACDGARRGWGRAWVGRRGVVVDRGLQQLGLGCCCCHRRHLNGWQAGGCASL